MTSNDDIMRALGSFETGLKAVNEQLSLIRQDIEKSEERAYESRSTIHRRLDEQSEQIGRLRTDVAINGEVDAHLRDRIKALSDTVDGNHKKVQPALEDWGRVKVLGWGVGFVFLSLGISAASIYAWAYDWAVSMVKQIFK
jgi:hypothetical protein